MSAKISQETFDETLLENQELFELSEQGAIDETISQFKQQGIDNLEAYIIISHPESETGIQERQTRKNFEVHLNALDACVAEDGTVGLDENDAALGSKQAEKIVNALEGILDYCNGTVQDENIIGETIYDKAMPFLTLFHSSSSLYTLMSFLGIVPLESEPTEDQMMVLNKVTTVMTAILSSRRPAEREIKAYIKDKFFAMERLLLLISFFVERCKRCDSHQDEFIDTLGKLVKLASVACRNSERNKVSLVRAFKNSKQSMENTSTIELLIRGIKVAVEAYKQEGSKHLGAVSLMTEFCQLISILCRYDDFRPGGALGVDSSYGMNVSSSHDHVMEFNRNGVVPVLYEITLIALTTDLDVVVENNECSTMEEDIVTLAAAALSATRVLAVNDESVQALVAVGILKVIKLALEMGVKEVLEGPQDGKKQEETKKQRQHLTSGAIGLVRNLCGNDEIKTTICLGTSSDPSSSSLHVILEGMRLYRDNASIQEHGLGALAAMALRKPTNALRIVQENAPVEIISAMVKFPNNVLVQRQGALAVRNIVSRLVANSSEMETTGSGDTSSIVANKTETINVRDVFLDVGAEVVLRQITGRHQGSVDEAYAALRDLGLEVSMLKFDSETQTMTRQTQMFGEVKSNFRAVYDETDAA